MHDKQVVITYKCDVNGDWTAPREQLTNTAVKVFTNKMDAIHFIGECTECQDNIKEVYPELFYWEIDSMETDTTNKQLEEFLINNI